MKQALDVMRIQLVNWPVRFSAPVAIMAATFAINYAIFASIGDAAPPEARTTGAILSIYITVGAAYLQSMTQVFPFALGLSVTRRAFYSGIALLAVAESLGYGLLLTLLNLLEQATGGWGLRLQFFGIFFLRGSNVAAQWLIYVGPFLAFIAVGVFTGVIFKRWGQAGVYAMALVGVLVPGGLAVLITWREWWPAVGTWLVDQPAEALFGGYPLVVAVVLGAGGWLALRRATP